MFSRKDNALARAIEKAAEQAFTDLFQRHPESYYYLTLITTGEAHPPFVAAWSHEALAAAVADAADPQQEREELKWSYADAPYMDYGSNYFEPVRALFDKRPPMDPFQSEKAWNKEYDIRLNAMETAMARLDAKGLFGTGAERLKKVVLVETMPPDYSNTLRAKRLNPPEALTTWLAEIAEDEDEAT